MNTENRPTTEPAIRPKSTLGFPLYIGAAMLAGILILVMINTRANYIQTLNSALPELDLQPLVNVDSPVTTSDMQGHLSVLHFWGTWCGPCMAEYPEFSKVYQSYSDNPNVKFYSISCSPGVEADLEKLRSETSEYLKSIDAKMPVYCDPAAYSRVQVGLILPSGSLGYPTTLVVDSEGRVRAFWEGAATPAELTRTIEKYLKS